MLGVGIPISPKFNDVSDFIWYWFLELYHQKILKYVCSISFLKSLRLPKSVEGLIFLFYKFIPLINLILRHIFFGVPQKAKNIDYVLNRSKILFYSEQEFLLGFHKNSNSNKKTWTLNKFVFIPLLPFLLTLLPPLPSNLFQILQTGVSGLNSSRWF